MREKIKQTIIDFTEEHGYPPTISEISNLVFRSHSVVHGYITDLLSSGELKSDHYGSPRAIRILRKPKCWIKRSDVIDLISSMAGCDGSDEYAVVWDDTCQKIIRAIEEM